MRRPPKPTFFTDRDLGNIIPNMLEDAGYSVERHDSHFGPTTPDLNWLRQVGINGWVALTRDKRIRYSSDSLQMTLRAGIPLFVLVGNTTHDILALNLVQTMPRVIDFLGKHQTPFVAKIYRPTPVNAVFKGDSGRVEMWVSWTDETD